MTLTRSDFSYQLPRSLIAQRPAEHRAQSRLMVLDGDQIRHLVFGDIVDLLRPSDLLVLNDTKVLKARLLGTKDSGGAAEVLVERIEDENCALCQVRVSKPLKPGRVVEVDGARIEVVERQGEFYRMRFPSPVDRFLDEHGHVPLPPYIGRKDVLEDYSRYQTVYAAKSGAVAAPTAGLHFDDALLDAIRARGVDIVTVTLHVGAGTFQPVRVDDLDVHRMHEERYEITPAARAAIDGCMGRVVAVGTTVVRTLESAALSGVDCGETDLFIRPGFEFRVVDALVTNFHLPESTLLMLVAAFAGHDRVRAAYEAAVAERYRFFSYGDAMFCERARV